MRSPAATQTILAIVDDLIARGHDLRNFCRDLLGLFRDLLVFKVAGEETQLFEAAVFSAEDMRAMAAAFTEADLMRFFNSLCETEASLREAAHPRYMLEIGLVKLIDAELSRLSRAYSKGSNHLAGVRSDLHRQNSRSPAAPLRRPARKKKL